MHITDDVTGVGTFQPRRDEERMYFANIECNGNETSFSECPVPHGPLAGTVWRGKVYCQWELRGGFFSFSYNYNVARINCCKLITIASYHQFQNPMHA